MRNLIKQRQPVWFCEVSETNDGLDRDKEYGKPTKHLMTVGWGTGEVGLLGSGVDADYDRQLTSYERDFHPKEGWMAFIDVEPDIDDDGYLSKDEDGAYITEPDYWVYKLIDTKKSINSRICAKRVE